jgi:glycosyltransferase involved in cell wall biosynthesis
MSEPMVSILIPAYNAQSWIAYTLKSVVDQTWKRKEIIVIDDGSTDRTAEIARRFQSKEVAIVSTENRGLSAAVNYAMRLSQGDYIQELDADDLLAPDKIERQLTALRDCDSKRTALSSPWAHFYYRTRRAQSIPNSLWQDLSPVEFLLRKMGENLHMQNATWLLSREITDAAGGWDESLHYDQDGEYYSRALLASEGTHFVLESRVFYRLTGPNRISYIGNSINKRQSMLRSMKLHVQYIRSLEDSERVRKACLTYLSNWSEHFHPGYPEMFVELQSLAAQLGGHLKTPALRMKYAWMTPIIGRNNALLAQSTIPEVKASMIRSWDRMMHNFENRKAPVKAASEF